MNHVLRKLSFLLLTGATVAQQQATTLWHLAEHASAVVVAAATSATDPNPEWHRIEFRTDEVLKGAVGPNFRLLEPAGRCCGHALFSVIPGQSYLLFLDRRGQTLHPLAGDRGVLAADPILVAHVRRLMTASSDVEATGRELAAALQMVDSRMAQDAALALSCLPTLPADGNAREGIRSALRREASAPTTALPALAAAVVRMDPAAAASNLLPLYLTTTQDDAARTLQFALDGIETRDLANAMQSQIFRDDAERVRAADLLAQRPDPSNLVLLNRMLAAADKPRVSLAVAEALLAHGETATSLQSRVAEVVLQLAMHRRAERMPLRVVQTGASR